MKYTRRQVEAAEITMDYFLTHYGPDRTLDFILESKKYMSLFFKIYLEQVYNLI